jgi:hypothetical protein
VYSTSESGQPHRRKTAPTSASIAPSRELPVGPPKPHPPHSREPSIASEPNSTTNDRPHEALDDDTPGSRYCTSPRNYTGKLPPIDYPGHFTVKRVTNQSSIRFKHKVLFLSRTLDRLPVGLEETGDGIWDLYFRPSSPSP